MTKQKCPQCGHRLAVATHRVVLQFLGTEAGDDVVTGAHALECINMDCPLYYRRVQGSRWRVELYLEE